MTASHLSTQSLIVGATTYALGDSVRFTTSYLRGLHTGRIVHLIPAADPELSQALVERPGEEGTQHLVDLVRVEKI